MGKYWVAGATGFLGRHLVEALTAAGHDTVQVSKSGRSDNGTSVESVNLLDEAAVEKSARGCDGAFLAAGGVSREREAAEELFQVHVKGTQKALGALERAGVRRVVYVSTSGTIAVGTEPDQVLDESASAPLEIIARWPYYRCKLYAEREALESNKESFQVVVVNPTLLLGPGDERESSTGDVRRFLDRSIPAVPAGGLSFVDVRDAANACVVAMERGRPGQRYLLSASNMTVAAFLKRLERLTGVKAPVVSMPKTRFLAIGANKLFSRALEAVGGKPPVDEISVEMAQYFWYCDPTKAERELGFSPRDPGETLRDTVEDLVGRKRAFPDGTVVSQETSGA